VGAKAELYQLIDRLCREGLGVILTSSELPELLTLADRIIVLAEGRLTAEESKKIQKYVEDNYRGNLFLDSLPACRVEVDRGE
jgi:ABC-type sugar transport system ATPase subunit